MTGLGTAVALSKAAVGPGLGMLRSWNSVKYLTCLLHYRWQNYFASKVAEAGRVTCEEHSPPLALCAVGPQAWPTD